MNYEPERKESNEIEDVLQHWGVKGMKWKKRKKRKKEIPDPNRPKKIPKEKFKNFKNFKNRLKMEPAYLGPLKVDLPVVAAAAVAIAATSSMPILVTGAAAVGAGITARYIVDRTESYRGRKALSRALGREVKPGGKLKDQPQRIPSSLPDANSNAQKLRRELEKRNKAAQEKEDSRRVIKPIPKPILRNQKSKSSSDLLKALQNRNAGRSALPKQFKKPKPDTSLKSKLPYGKSKRV